MLVTFDVLKLLKSMLVNESHAPNISLMSVTSAVFKGVTSRLLKPLQL